ncbi:subtilisin-like proprotein convertase family protein [Flavobacterium sp. 28YEA47A]|uniref:proprotein convertase P-domain-containing protein n=1 Tax=Flavobacterium sp. 28YEA47A TaxID=3156276 RepID=UPI0035199E86
MKTDFLRFKKSDLKMNLMFLLALMLVNCSKDDNSEKPPEDTRLALPATLENNTPLPIPDATNLTGACGSNATPGSAENSIEITADGIIANPSKVSIEVDISHTFGSDVVLELFTPSGDSVGLIKRIGAANNTVCGTDADFIAGNKLVFNSANTTLLAAPFVSGNYAPTSGMGTFPTTVMMTPLATFLTGKNIKGVWRMKMYDCGVDDTGKLNSWKLKFDTGALQ